MDIKLTLDRFEDDKAILKSENNETIIWSKNLLPKNAKEGEVLAFTVLSDKEKSGKNKELAKSILNEILNPED